MAAKRKKHKTVTVRYVHEENRVEEIDGSELLFIPPPGYDLSGESAYLTNRANLSLEYVDYEGQTSEWEPVNFYARDVEVGSFMLIQAEETGYTGRDDPAVMLALVQVEDKD